MLRTLFILLLIFHPCPAVTVYETEEENSVGDDVDEFVCEDDLDLFREITLVDDITCEEGYESLQSCLKKIPTAPSYRLWNVCCAFCNGLGEEPIVIDDDDDDTTESGSNDYGATDTHDYGTDTHDYEHEYETPDYGTDTHDYGTDYATHDYGGDYGITTNSNNGGSETYESPAFILTMVLFGVLFIAGWITLYLQYEKKLYMDKRKKQLEEANETHHHNVHVAGSSNPSESEASSESDVDDYESRDGLLSSPQHGRAFSHPAHHHHDQYPPHPHQRLHSAPPYNSPAPYGQPHQMYINHPHQMTPQHPHDQYMLPEYTHGPYSPQYGQYYPPGHDEYNKRTPYTKDRSSSASGSSSGSRSSTNTTTENSHSEYTSTHDHSHDSGLRRRGV